MKKRFALAIAASLLFSLHIQAQQPAADADTVIKAVTMAMGTARLRSVQYTGTGSINPTGQAYTTGGAWPRYTVTKYTMSIDFSLPAMRQELIRIDDAKVPRGGGAGGYNPQTFQGGIRPIPGDIIQNNTIDARATSNASARAGSVSSASPAARTSSARRSNSPRRSFRRSTRRTASSTRASGTEPSVTSAARCSW